MNPYLIALVAAGALWLLFGGKKLPTAPTSDNTVPLTDAMGAGGPGSATVLPPGSTDAGNALVSTYSSQPVGGDGSSQAAQSSGPYTSDQLLAVGVAPNVQAQTAQAAQVFAAYGSQVTPALAAAAQAAASAPAGGGSLPRHAGDISS